MKLSDAMDRNLQRVGRLGLIAGGVATVLSLVLGMVLGRTEFFQCYLQSYIFWSGLAVGSLAILMVHHLCGGEWGFVIQRPLEAAARTIPLIAVLFIPILVGMHDLYHWSHTEAVQHDEILAYKSVWLNPIFFVVRAVLYFAIWIGMAHMLRTWSLAQDASGDEKLYRPMRVLSGIGALVYALTVTFAGWDWTMSLDPHWFSSMWGPHFMISQVLTALTFMAILLHVLTGAKPLSDVVKSDHFHSLGNLTFAFVILWTYMTFSPFLIIWSANLPEGIIWYQNRSSEGWKIVAVLLTLFHFVVPFFLLLSRFSKMRSGMLWKSCLFIFLMRFVDLHWIIGAEFHVNELGEHVFGASLLNLTLPVALGGFWLALFVRYLRQAPIVPLHDTRFAYLTQSQGDAHHG